MRKKIDPVLIDVPMPITTPRLELRAVAPGYGQQQLDAINESLDSLRPWMGWVHHADEMTLEARESWLRHHAAAFIRREKLFMLAFEGNTGTLVGGTGFHDIDWDVPSFGIGYWVRPSTQGQGYATEMTVALTRYAFLALKAVRVEITHSSQNSASRRVIEKAGFMLEGTRRRDHWLPAERGLDDTLVYSHIDINDVPKLEVKW
jgi:ribosomal-protein-serine acetyltransferase